MLDIVSALPNGHSVLSTLLVTIVHLAVRGRRPDPQSGRTLTVCPVFNAYYPWHTRRTRARSRIRDDLAVDRTAGRRCQTTMPLTFFGWCEAMAHERRSRWLASRVESNSCKRLLSLTMGHWRIEARALTRAAARQKEEAAALQRTQAREADRLAMLSSMAELVSRRRNNPNMSQSQAPSLESNNADSQPSVEAMAEAVVADLVEQERAAALQQLADEKKTRSKRRRAGAVSCCSRPGR
jgi:hypothetical protein